MNSRDALVESLLGAPYDKFQYHCWWLATLVEREVFGRELPVGPQVDPGRHERARLLADHPARAEWREYPTPEDGDLVLMARVPGKEIHCGVFLADRRGVIHTDEPHGVVIDPVAELRHARRWWVAFHRPLIS